MIYLIIICRLCSCFKWKALFLFCRLTFCNFSNEISELPPSLYHSFYISTYWTCWQNEVLTLSANSCTRSPAQTAWVWASTRPANGKTKSCDIPLLILFVTCETNSSTIPLTNMYARVFQCCNTKPQYSYTLWKAYRLGLELGISNISFHSVDPQKLSDHSDFIVDPSQQPVKWLQKLRLYGTGVH
jgi:hypothetical protein